MSREELIAYYVPPSLPTPLLLAVAALTFIIIVVVMARRRDRSAVFVIGASWLRYVMSAFHAITYKPALAGMSMNALASIGVFLIGLATINWRHLAMRVMVPFYVLIVIAIVSAFANGNAGAGLITVLSKYGYLIVIMLSVFAALQRAKDGGRFMEAMLWAFAPILIFQAFSLILGIGKHTETDLSAMSYIGGYNHEAAFSVALATCLTIACFTTRLQPQLKFGIILVCIAGIVLANYRTTLVAIMPLLLFYFGFSSLRKFPLRDRPFVVSAIVLGVVVFFGLASLLFAERFQDIGVAMSGEVNFFKRYEEYTVAETRLLSGRPAIWSRYIFAWIDGGLLQHVFGFGPEAWEPIFPIYAHNTLVNYLYEYGLLGVISILYLWLTMLSAALRIRHPHGGIVIGAHLSFLMLNMSTMPMWMIEGNILYGVICGYTLHLLALQNTQARRAATAAKTPAPAKA